MKLLRQNKEVVNLFSMIAILNISDLHYEKALATNLVSVE